MKDKGTAVARRGQGSVPVVSVVIPTYRHQDYVTKTLESVWAQTFGDYEVIVVNDGSPDRTHEVLQPYVQSGRIDRYIHQDNAGQSAARNRGVVEARGEFIALLDDDDLLPRQKLEWQVDILRRHPDAVMVYGRAANIDATDREIVPRGADGKRLILPGETPTGEVYGAFLQKNWILSPGQALIRRDVLNELDGPFDIGTALRGCDDWDLWVRLAERGLFHFHDRLALRYRFHAANASRDTLQMHRATIAMQKKHLRLTKNHPERHALAKQAYRAACLWSARELILQAYADRKRDEPELAWRKLLFLYESQPALFTHPMRLRQLFAAAMHLRRSRKASETPTISENEPVRASAPARGR
ncbi:MAG: glycosyltransferase [bacterium]|jgi:glycosyltransferase involved in cell wall biosynthesis